MMASLFLFGVLGPMQIGIIILALLLFFGGKIIPELMKGVGQGMKEFKKATKDVDEVKENTN